jgi:hypothetical protein
VRSLAPVRREESVLIKRRGVAGGSFVALIALKIGLIGLLQAFKGPIDVFLIRSFSVLTILVVTASCLSLSRSF